jgi:hypothetical protein
MGLRDRLFKLLHLPARVPERVEILADEVGVRRIRDGQKATAALHWSDVTEIRVFKRDLGTVDDVRLAFHVHEGWYEFSEDEPGFEALGKMMQPVFPEVPEDWYTEAVVPPFATNERILFRRRDSAMGE